MASTGSPAHGPGAGITAPIRLGVLGTADIAVRRVLPAVRRAPGIEVAAVASRSPDRARTLAATYECPAVHGYDSLLRREDIDAVYIPLPAALHARWIENALLAGKHVLAEKPLTTSFEDTVRLVALARERHLVLAENYFFPHHAQHAAVARILDEGVLGDLHSFEAHFAVPRRPDRDIRYRADLGGGALLDTGGYPVRAAQLFLGPELTVAGAVLRQDRALGVDIGGAALLAAGDVSVQLSFGLDHAYRSGYRFHGSGGQLWAEHVFTTPAQQEPVLHLVLGDTRQTRTLPADDQVLNAVGAFADAVRHGDSPDSGPSVRQAALIDRIRDLAPK